MRTVILVDDDRTNSKLIRMLLEMDGFQVILCPDAQKAKQAAGNGVDAFIIDCNLTKGDDGISLLAEIRAGATSASPEIPIIMTSGDERRNMEAEEAGATGFMLKPYSSSILSEELRKLLS